MHETRQIAEGIVILHQSDLTPFQAFLARLSGRFYYCVILVLKVPSSFTHMPCTESAVIALKQAF